MHTFDIKLDRHPSHIYIHMWPLGRLSSVEHVREFENIFFTQKAFMYFFSMMDTRKCLIYVNNWIMIIILARRNIKKCVYVFPPYLFNLNTQTVVHSRNARGLRRKIVKNYYTLFWPLFSDYLQPLICSVVNKTFSETKLLAKLGFILIVILTSAWSGLTHQLKR